MAKAKIKKTLDKKSFTAKPAKAAKPVTKKAPAKKPSTKKTVAMVKKHLKEDIKMFQHEAAEDKKLIKKLKK